MYMEGRPSMYKNIRRKNPGRGPPLPPLRGKYVDRINEVRVLENERKNDIGPLGGVDRNIEDGAPSAPGRARGVLGKNVDIRIEVSPEVEVKNR